MNMTPQEYCQKFPMTHGCKGIYHENSINKKCSFINHCLNQIVTYISCNLSTEPVETATVNYGTYLPNEPSDPYVGTFDGTSQSVVISGSEGYESPEPFKGIDIP